MKILVIPYVLLVGAILVTTPQDIALLDTRRGAEMFKNVDIPVSLLVNTIVYNLSVAMVIGVGNSSKHECVCVPKLWTKSLLIWK